MKLVLLFILTLNAAAFPQDRTTFRNSDTEAVVKYAYVQSKDYPTLPQSPVAGNVKWYGFRPSVTNYFIQGNLDSPTVFSNFGTPLSNNYNAMEYADSVIYCIAIAAGSPLQKINKSTGELTTLRPITGEGINLYQITGMSYNCIDKKMYLLGNRDGSFRLYQLNIETGGTILIGSTTQIFDIAINRYGECYGVSINDKLYNINLSNGNYYEIGNIGFNASFLQSLCFGETGDTLWYASYNGDNGLGEMRILDTENGSSRLIGPFVPSSEILGLCIELRKPVLTDFSITEPAPNIHLISSRASEETTTFMCDSIPNAINYKLIIETSNPYRRMAFNSSSNILNISMEQLDIAMAINGFTNNGSETDSAEAEWNIWVSNPFAQDPDSLVSINGPRPLSIRRELSSLPLRITALSDGNYNLTTGKTSQMDSVKFYLRDGFPPYNLVDSAIGYLDTNGVSNILKFFNAEEGNHYIIVKGNNLLETWSNAISLYHNIYDYDFTTSQSKAYGNNMIRKGTKYCLFNGDVDQDGVINLNDVIKVFNNAANFNVGNSFSDLNGDLNVNLSDVLIAYVNSISFVKKRVP